MGGKLSEGEEVGPAMPVPKGESMEGGDLLRPQRPVVLAVVASGEHPHNAQALVVDLGRGAQLDAQAHAGVAQVEQKVGDAQGSGPRDGAGQEGVG
jgi:hypothetical protein